MDREYLEVVLALGVCSAAIGNNEEAYQCFAYARETAEELGEDPISTAAQKYLDLLRGSDSGRGELGRSVSR